MDSFFAGSLITPAQCAPCSLQTVVPDSRMRLLHGSNSERPPGHAPARFTRQAKIVSLTRLFRGVSRASSHSGFRKDHRKRVDETRSSDVTGVHMRRDRSTSAVFLRISLGALLPGLFIGGVAFPQTSFFQGKTVTILESSAPGGVGSMRTKAVVPFLQKYIPGNPTIMMQYMDGGGGRKAANHLYKSVRPDGLTIGRMSTPFVMQPILGESGILYDIDKVSYLGTSYSGGYHVFFTRREAGLDSLEKLARLPVWNRLPVGRAPDLHFRPHVRAPDRVETAKIRHWICLARTGCRHRGRRDRHSLDRGGRSAPRETGMGRKNLMDFHAIIEIPKGRKHAHPRFAALADIESFAKTALERKLVALYRISSAAAIRSSFRPAHQKTG